MTDAEQLRRHQLVSISLRDRTVNGPLLQIREGHDSRFGRLLG